MTYNGRFNEDPIDRKALDFHNERAAYNFAEAMTRIQAMIFCFDKNLPIPDFTEKPKPTTQPTPYFKKQEGK